MDEEVDPDEDNVNSVLAQESSELFHILKSQSPEVIMQLCQMMPNEAGWSINHADPSAQHIKSMLEHFRLANAAECRNFLQSMCLLCENIPMHLESRLMSVAGYANTDVTQCPSTEPASQSNTVAQEYSKSSENNEKPSSPSSLQQLIKRPRIDHWEQYIISVRSLLLRKWERQRQLLVQDVQLENVWVSPRISNRGRDRPDQTPESTDRGSRTPEPDVDFGSLEARVTLETFLQGCVGKVTVLLGQAGSGKTLLMSCLGQQWAHGLGPIPSSSLFVLLEFRQLALLSHPLSLFDLLFHHYLFPREDDNEKQAIVDYILSNPEQSCWVLDGYDEFHIKLNKPEVQREPWDPTKPHLVSDLISGLLNRQLLPGCTVVVTCRVRDVLDLEGVSDKVGQLLGWDHQEVEKYVHNFFDVKANPGLAAQAADLLLSNQHLIAMSSVPAHCNICCICLEHLLLEERVPGETQMPEESGSETWTAKGNELKGGQISGGGKGAEGSRGRSHEEMQDHKGRRKSVDNRMDGINGRAQLPLTQAQMPSTLTQVYLTVFSAFLRRDPDKEGKKDKLENTRPYQSVACTLSQYQSELCELSHLAWKGYKDNRILFMEEEISRPVLELSIRVGLFSQMEVRREDGMLVNSYFFIHLTLQEFLGAVRVMTSLDVSDTQLKKRFSLRTRWTTKSDQRTVFTDSLHLFVCGLSSPQCTQALVQLARKASGTGAQNWVKKRQALVLNLLKNLCHRDTLTGPKVLELCHCVQESQDQQLAKQVVGTRPTLELRRIQLLPIDIDALAFVVNSVGDIGVGLDFGACSMELECLDALTRCQYIHYLCFRSRKYGDKFAEKLSTILSKFPTLRKLEFCGASLTATGAAVLAPALQDCPNLTELNLSDNNLKDEGIELIADVFANLPGLVSIMLGRNNISLEGVNCLIRKTSSCLNIQHIHADGLKDLTVTFSPTSDLQSSHHNNSEPTISLLNQKWSKRKMQELAKSLACCPAFCILDLSGVQWDVQTLKTLTQLLPKFKVTKKIILNESCSSVKDLVILTALLSDCPAVRELYVRLQSPVEVSVGFSGGREQPGIKMSKKLCLSCCALLPADLERIWQSFGRSSDVTFIDLSSNCLDNKGLKKLLDFLPRLRSILEINASNNGISMGGVVMLAGALCSHSNLTQVLISDGGRERLILKFCRDRRAEKQKLKIFRLNNSSLLPTDMTKICERLGQCHSHLELDFSHSSLTDEAIQNLLKVLPKMKSLQRLNVSHSISSTSGAVTLLSCLTVSQRVKSVELRHQFESFVHFDSVKAEQARCRFTGFSLNADNYERLLSVLQHGPQLSALDLSGNQLEDEGLKRFLETLPRLKVISYVNMSKNSLTQHGLLDVVSTLCDCANVSGVEVSLGAEQRCLVWFTQQEGGEKTLSVREGNLEQDHLVRIGEILSTCPSLSKLKFQNNDLESDWIEGLVKTLNSSQRGLSVSVEERWIRSDEVVSLLCQCLEARSDVHTIGVHHNTMHLTLKKDTELTSVSLVDCAVKGYQLAPMTSIIQRYPSLREMDFSHNHMDIEGAEFLASVLPSLPNLTSLSFSSKEIWARVAERLSETLLQATAIQSLNLSSHVVSDTAAQSMARIMPRLQSLNLSHCVCSEAGGLQLIKALGECVGLERLCLDSWQLSKESGVCLAQALRNVNSIRILKLNKIDTADSGLDLLAAMEGLTQIEEIGLDGWMMADKGLEQLTRLLPLWGGLRRFSLSKSLISDQSGDKLLDALKCCSHLEELHLCSNSLGDLTAARMALVLPSLTHITVLDISENNIRYEGSVSLSKAIMCLKNLTKMHLTSVGTPELCAVASSLAHCPLIQHVGLGWNNCGDNVAEELARVMPLCHRLSVIDLESNSVSVTGAEALFEALQSCPALQLIRLWRNKITPSEAQSLSLQDRRLNFSST
ncbi:NLR family, CARD domain containing 5 [Labrus bergylta]|uniref:NLR family, CARD domain containing 5 n=1 Tax=Labrus bergylta TaxID=56723 RepID=UPI0009B37A37|nr:protein NLRC5 [Labrus bergylta]